MSAAPVDVLATGGPPHRTPAFHTLRVAAVDRLTDDSVAITFDVPPELRDDYSFAPGQHLTVRWSADGSDARRNYSICSSAVSGSLQVAVKQIRGGVFSTYAAGTLRPGDTLEVMTPTGRFTPRLHPEQARHYAAIAAGSGITPVLSILQTALEVEPGSRCTLIYANRTTSSIMFLEELADLKNRFPGRFALYHVLSRERHDVELFSGRLEQGKLSTLLDTLLPPDTVDEWFLCGPMELVQSARATLLDRGVNARHVHLELFHVEDAPPRQRAADEAEDEGEGSAVTVLLDGRTSTLTLPPRAESILDAVLKVRADAPYACKGGVCGTCRAKLVDGKVEMDRNFALEPDELEAGFVLACQSHPASESVTLDFDV